MALAVTDLVTFGHFEQLSRYIKTLPATTPALCASILQGLEKTHSPPAVQLACSLLATSRAGLTDDDVVRAARPMAGGDDAAALTEGSWERVRAALNPFLSVQSHTSAVAFAHSALASAARRRYLHTTSSRVQAHRRLCQAFREDADPLGNQSWFGLHSRSLSETLYHAQASNEWGEVVGMLTNLAFLAAATANGMLADVNQAYVAMCPGRAYSLLRARRLTGCLTHRRCPQIPHPTLSAVHDDPGRCRNPL